MPQIEPLRLLDTVAGSHIPGAGNVGRPHVEVLVGGVGASGWELVDVHVEQPEPFQVGQVGFLFDLPELGSDQVHVTGLEVASWLEPFAELSVPYQQQ